MKENKGVGPNLKTYYYYTNEAAETEDVKGVVVVASGIEATGALYDEMGEYLSSKGYAMYAIDEWGYGKTGKVTKEIYKNWGKKSAHFAAYNLHALSVLAKSQHPSAPIYLVANDFGAMLSLYLLKEFPEVVDKIVTIGWGAPRMQDYGFLFTSWIRKVCLYDSGVAKLAHFSKNKRLALRFERHEKYAWLSSDLDQVKKIREAGYIDEAGTVGHYFYYYLNKVKIPMFMKKIKKCDRTTPMLFVSGNDDLLTLRGRKTKKLAKFYKSKKFTNVNSLIVKGRHELLFEKNRFENMDTILEWLETGEVNKEIKIASDKYEQELNVEIVGENKEIVVIENKTETPIQNEVIEEVEVDVKKNQKTFDELQPADDDLLIKTNKESK